MTQNDFDKARNAVANELAHRKFTWAEKVLIDNFVGQRLRQAQKALASLEEAFATVQEQWLAKNIEHWQHVIAGLKWCVATLEPNPRRRRGKRPPAGQQPGDAATLRGQPNGSPPTG